MVLRAAFRKQRSKFCRTAGRGNAPEPPDRAGCHAGLPVYNHIIGDEIKNTVQLFELHGIFICLSATERSWFRSSAYPHPSVRHRSGRTQGRRNRGGPAQRHCRRGHPAGEAAPKNNPRRTALGCRGCHRQRTAAQWHGGRCQRQCFHTLLREQRLAIPGRNRQPRKAGSFPAMPPAPAGPYRCGRAARGAERTPLRVTEHLNLFRAGHDNTAGQQRQGG